MKTEIYTQIDHGTAVSQERPALFVGYATAVYNTDSYLFLVFATRAHDVAQAEQNAIEAIKRIVANSGGDVHGGKYTAVMARAHGAMSFYGVVGAVRHSTLHTRFVEFACTDSAEATRQAKDIATRTFPPSEGYTSHGLSIDHIQRVLHQFDVQAEGD